MRRKLSKTPLVGILMGSDSDLPAMSDACDILKQFLVSYEITILSAHRAPFETYAYAKGSIARGLKVIIAGAGGAAHLPGIIAAITTIPVIGVPIQSKTLQGVDSLYAIVQMPSGVPVATVAINGATNAGLLAVQILALSNPSLASALVKYKETLKQSVLQKVEQLERLGIEAYVRQKQ